MTLRQDSGTDDWLLRPWIMAAVCAVAGLLFNQLVDFSYNAALSPLRQTGATFVAIAAVSFVLTVEQRRWTWSVAFALGWGAVVALVGWFTAGYNQQGEIFEWPFLSGLFAVLLAAPLFQTMRDEGAWRFPYPRLHGHAWTDAVIGAASLAFVGVAFLLAWLIAGLFNLIGIDLIKDLLNKEWFGWMLAGFAFGSAVGLLRERDALVATLQRLVMVVLGVLAPVLASALIAFLASLPFTGLAKLWDSAIPATPMMLVAGAGAILLANAVIGNGTDDRATSRVLRIAALALVLTVLPLAIIAAVSLAQRIGQYGWTPERIWGVVAVAVAIFYGVAGWWAVGKGRIDFDDVLRPLQTRMALGLCGLTLFLALPILDFGAVSARSQFARLQADKVEPGEFDWAAMAFDFGPAGRKRLATIARTGAADQRALAAKALRETNRGQLATEVEARRAGRQIQERLRLASPNIVLTGELLEAVGKSYMCRNEKSVCVLTRIGLDRYLVVSTNVTKDTVISEVIDLARNRTNTGKGMVGTEATPVESVNLDTARLEVRKVERRQLYVDGKPVGEPFE